jgi:hypothetical protein
MHHPRQNLPLPSFESFDNFECRSEPHDAGKSAKIQYSVQYEYCRREKMQIDTTRVKDFSSHSVPTRARGLSSRELKYTPRTTALSFNQQV